MSIEILVANFQILEKLIPRSDKIFVSFGKVNYEDCFCLNLETKTIFDIDFIIFKIIKTLPNWVKLLLNLRNKIVSIFGLKTGKIWDVYDNPEILNFKQGQSIGNLSVILKGKYHLITELKDKHLDFRVSILIREEEDTTKVYFSTIVKYNNIFGKMYFFLIAPFHRLIIPSTLKRLCIKI